MNKCFRCGVEILDEEEYCEQCVQIRNNIDEHMRKKDRLVNIGIILGLLVLIPVLFYAVTYLPLGELVNILFFVIIIWGLWWLPHPGP